MCVYGCDGVSKRVRLCVDMYGCLWMGVGVAECVDTWIQKCESERVLGRKG